jgi:type VI secretion system protein VasJ
VPVEYDTLRTRADAWLAPIDGPSPAGASARFDPEYQALADEVGKLDAPTGGEIDWKRVVQGAGALLERKSKDLTVAAYLAHALHRTQGLSGLTTGLVLLSESIDRYWEPMFPDVKRPRGRANALQWFTEKTQHALDKARPGPLAEMEGLEAAARRLGKLAREKLGELCPAFGPVIEPVERLRNAALPPPAPRPPPPPAAAETAPGAPAAAPAGGGPVAPAATSPVPAAPVTAPLPVAPAAGADPTDFLRNVGTALAAVAGALRQADLSDARAYRLLRTALWLHVAAPPPAQGGRTQIPPPPAALRAQLQALEGNQKWAALLQETEGASLQQRFWLDLHRLGAQALAALGPAHAAAREAVVSEVRSLLARLPQLATLSFSDGTPLADPRTRAWLDEEVAAAVAAPRGAAPEAAAEKVAEAKKLLAAGKPGDALALLRDEALRARGGRDRFRLRAETARLCSGAGLTAIAKALYEELDREIAAHRLDEWEPALAAECLKGLLASARALSKDPRGTLPDLTEPYKRLCRIDPAAAHEVWP